MSATKTAIDFEKKVAATNYDPLPLVLTEAKGVWAKDADGKRYLDMMSAYSAVSMGHGHPRILAAMMDQAQKLAVTSRAYHTEVLGPFLDRLVKLTGLDVALPMNTGAEAVETAIKAARRWGHHVKGIAKDRAEIIVAEQNFHGRTTTIIGFSSDESYRDGFGPFTGGFKAVPFADAAAVEAAITPNTAAVLIEPIQGEAGIIVPPDGYLRQLREICTRHNVMLIVDEVQAGLGRTGKWFAHQHDGIRPDGLILGKALGGGVYPVSAFVGTREFMQVFNPGSHGSTFGGNALAARIGLEALNVIEDEGLVENSRVMGEYLFERLSAMRALGHDLVVLILGVLSKGSRLIPERVPLYLVLRAHAGIQNCLHTISLPLGTFNPRASLLTVLMYAPVVPSSIRAIVGLLTPDNVASSS